MKVKFKKDFQHTIIMQCGRPLAIIVHYTVQFNLSVAKALYRTWALILLRKFEKIIIRRIESKFKRFPTYNHYEIW